MEPEGEDQMKKNMTNEEFLVHLMNFSRNGALMQGFIMEGLRIYSEQVLEMDDEDRAKMNKSFIPYDSWASCAREMLEAQDEKYNSARSPQAA
jgi:hypothetical protein